MALPAGTIEAVKEYERIFDEPIRVMLLRDSRVRDLKNSLSRKGLDFALTCDFSKPEKIAETLLPYQDQLLAVSCRQEQALARFAQVIPHVPYLRTPSTESLRWASDKYEMRRRFSVIDKTLNPKFTRIKNNSHIERERVIKKVGFPMIVKPASMVASLYVTICYHEDELEKAVRTISRRLNAAYKRDNRLEVPKIIAEEHMEGHQYSIDSYVNSRGGITHCPLVRQKTAREIGHDDFYTYLQTTPTALKKNTVQAAETAAQNAIHALGLRSTITHTELMKIDDEWKVIEIGARMGGFRHVLHKLSCDINHSLNDILVRVPKKPIVPKKCKGFACAMKWFAEKEGQIIEMKGIKKIEELESFNSITLNKKLGDKAIFARNGGRSVFNLFMYNSDRSKLLADIRRVEQLVEVKVATRGTAKKSVVAKKITKKVTKAKK